MVEERCWVMDIAKNIPATSFNISERLEPAVVDSLAFKKDIAWKRSKKSALVAKANFIFSNGS